MSANYAQHFSPKITPQSQPIPNKDMVKNSAGGFVFQTDPMSQVLRFLILGCEGGTYYASENKLSIENAANTVSCIKTNAKAVVDLIVDVSTNGRAAKQDATIFALALACTFAGEKEKPYAYAAISRVCRTGTHIFTFTNYIQTLRGWSRGLRNGVSKFYTMKPLDKLELQLVKYRQRQGFTHKDVMRLAHPSTKETTRNELFKYAVGKESEAINEFKLVHAYEEAKTLDVKTNAGAKKIVQLITDSGLPREGVPTGFLKNSDVWHALLERMPVGAMIRNLGKMSSLDMTKSNLSDATIKIVSTLRDPDFIKRSRIHPMQILTAIVNYGKGHGDKGSLSWSVSSKIMDVLNDAFYLSFGNVEVTRCRIMEALDLSASMTWTDGQGLYGRGGYGIKGSPLTPRQASAAMAMITTKVEPNYDIVGFTCGANRFTYPGANLHGGIESLSISGRQRLDDVINYIGKQHAGGTDCALPMLYAAHNKIPVDVFKIHTDNETWAGGIHAKQALDQYRQKMGIDAKLVVLAYSSSKNSIADPQDRGMLDVIGFDTATPNLISQFSLGLL